MKKLLYLFLFFIWIASFIVTVKDLISNHFLQEIENLKSLKYPDKYMTIDTLIIVRTYQRGSTDDNNKIIEGKLISNDSIINLNIFAGQYLYDPSKIVVYKSRLTNRYFIKNAHPSYIHSIKMGLYTSLFFKIYFFSVMAYLIFKLKKTKTK